MRAKRASLNRSSASAYVRRRGRTEMQCHAKLVGDCVNSTRSLSICIPALRETPTKSINPVDRINHYFRHRIMTALECHELKYVMELRAGVPRKIRNRSTHQTYRIISRHPMTTAL